MNIESILRMQRQFFDSRQTFDIDTRLQGLRRLREAILAHEEEINAALKEDLGKSASESYMCETGMTLAELRPGPAPPPDEQSGQLPLQRPGGL